MMTATPYASASDISADDYIVVGLAVCFTKDDDGLHEVNVAEPIPSAALEAILKGIPTSYRQAYATTVGAVVTDETLQLPAHFPTDTQFCEDFAARLISAARTFKACAAAQQHIPLHTVREDMNFSTERKRVLNLERVVKTEDNVKQHAYTHQVL